MSTSPKLCVTVTAETTAELRQRRDAVSDADLIELRLDTVRDPDVAAALGDRRRPVIVTCRAAWEGGSFRGSEDERRALLRQARALGAEFVDVEWRATFDDVIGDGRGIVLSHHEFGSMPRDLADRLRAMRSRGVEVVKLAAAVASLKECAAIATLTPDTDSATVVVAMGDAGLASRVLPGRFGSRWTYAGHGAAPGQIPPERLLHDFGFRRHSAVTQVFGVVGRPVMHSLSPAMHNAAFLACGVDAVYLPLAAVDLDDFFAFAVHFGVAGASVTAPFKVDAAARVSESDDLSRRVGALNTLRAIDGRWHGRNTDGTGFLAPLAGRLSLAGVRATLLGAGGAARTVAETLRREGVRVTVAARQRDRADAVAAVVGATVAEWPPPADWDLLVNTTPVGTFPSVDESPLPGGPFASGLVYDLVYNPGDTRLLRDARRAGCATLGGLDMLVAQAAAQFTWWTGIPAPVTVMRASAQRALASLNSAVLTPHPALS